MAKTRRPRQKSIYGQQLAEKQELKKIYGIREKQLRRYVEAASKMQGSPSENLLKLLELRLDNVVFRLGFAKTRPHARQLVSHGFFRVNNRRVTIPSLSVKIGDEISPRRIEQFKDFKPNKVSWIDFNSENTKAVPRHIPSRVEIDTPINENLVIQFYSR